MSDTSTAQEYRNGYIPVYDSDSFSYQQFVQNHLAKNQPCIVKNIHTDEWRIHSRWLNASQTVIDYDYLCTTYGDVQVEVAQCGQLYGDEDRKKMTLRDYLQFLKQSKLKMQQSRPNSHTQQLQQWIDGVHRYKLSKFDPRWTADILYCKDWHIVGALSSQLPSQPSASVADDSSKSSHPNNGFFYSTPPYFADDWLNYYCDQTAKNKMVDFRFCYLGPQCSWTPLHFDVHSSFSWSANVLGKKLWIMFDPEESRKYLYHADESRNESIGHLLALLDEDADELDKQGYSHLNELFANDNALLCSKMVIQHENEAIFVPSMWHHEVYNLSDVVLSINHNWFNAFNLAWVWNGLCKEYRSVCQLPMAIKLQKLQMVEIMSEDEVYRDCQKLLRDACGLDFEEFLQMVTVNVEHILHELHERQAVVEFLKEQDEEDGDVEVSDAFKFEIECCLVSLKHVMNVIQKCVATDCMNGTHVQQLNEMSARIKQDCMRSTVTV